MKKIVFQRKLLPYLLLVLLFFIMLFSIKLGAVKISNTEIFSALKKYFFHHVNLSLNENIFLQIRLPRVLLGVIVGAALAVGGVVMQAIFRNPIVEPGLLGTSSGAAFGAACYFVAGSEILGFLGEFSLPFYACIGGVLSTFLVLKLSHSKQNKESSIITLLLIGVAINALFMSGVGFMSYLARDPQARSINFWNLGTLSGANWSAVFICGVTTILCILIIYTFHKQLNSLILGQDEAFFLGVDVAKMKVTVLLFNVVMIAIATAFVGVISFVGLIIPHLLRLLIGADNKALIINGAIMGAAFLCLVDLFSRIALQPAELPIGILTA